MTYAYLDEDYEYPEESEQCAYGTINFIEGKEDDEDLYYDKKYYEWSVKNELRSVRFLQIEGFIPVSETFFYKP